MLRPTTHLLIASGAFVLASAGGCDGDKLDVGAALRPAANALAVPPLGQELLRLFDAQKQQAQAAEQPAQF